MVASSVHILWKASFSVLYIVELYGLRIYIFDY